MSHPPYQFRPCSGLFEAHITVMPLSAGEQDRFVGICKRLGVKPILIELPQGDVSLQLMTSSVHRGEVRDAFQEVQRLALQLEKDGFPVTRIKLEAAPFNSGIPQNDLEAADFPPDNYYEHHLKVLLAPGDEPGRLRSLCDRHGAHLSRNAFKHHPDGKSEQFVTLRCYGRGLQESEMRFSALIRDVRSAGFQVLKQITEYCLFDDNISVDSNWGNFPKAATIHLN